MTRLRLVAVPVGVALRRMRERSLTTALFALAAAGAATLIGWSSLTSTVAQEDNVRLRLAEVAPGARSIQAVAFVAPLEPPELHAQAVDLFFGRFGHVTASRHRVRIWSPVAPADEFGTRFVLVSRPDEDVAISSGRLPTGCRGDVCEAVGVAGGFRVGQTVRLGRDVVVHVVGRGSVRADVLPQRVRPFGGDDRTLLVSSVDPPLDGLLHISGSVVVDTAQLAPERVHGAGLRSLQTRLGAETVRLERTDSSVEASAPVRLSGDIARRGEIARDRLLLVAAQGAALIVAFGAFAAALRRRERTLVDDQLSVLGGSRPQVALARLVEAVIPGALGLLLALAGLRLAVELVRRHRRLPDDFVGAALPGKTVLAIVGVTAVGVALSLASGGRARRQRLGMGALELAALTALGVVVWQASTTGALDPAQLAARGGGRPILLLVPGLTFFAAAVLLVRVVPVALRCAERLTRGAPFGLRLAFLTAARNPSQAAAATTFLAVALGSALFSLGYAATLDRQARDEASFAAGARWRVLERGGGATYGPPDVTPLTRYRVASTEPPTPVIRLNAQVQDPAAPAGQGRPVQIVGVPAARIPEVRGWRASFSSLTRAQIAERLRPRALALRGHALAPDAVAIRLWARGMTQYPRKVVAYFLQPKEQRFGFVQLGFVWKRWTRLHARVPATLRGAQLVGLEFLPTAVPIGRELDLNGYLELGRVEQRRSSGWAPFTSLAGWSPGRPPVSAIQVQPPISGFVGTSTIERGAPISAAMRFDLRASALPLLRPTLALPEAIPAIVSGPVGRTAVATVSAGPTVRITSRPPASTTERTARFEFASDAGGPFFCFLGGTSSVEQCQSPVTYKGLRPGSHQFLVTTIDAAGNSGEQRVEWTILPGGTHAGATPPAAATPTAPPPPKLPTTAKSTCSGIVTLDVEGRLLPVRVVGCARRFPSIVQPRSSFVAVDYDTLFAALNADRPGAQLPNEAWFFDRQRADFVARLRRPPFRVQQTVDVDALRTRFLDDPLAVGTRNVLVVSTLAAALLAVLGLALAVRSALSAERTLLGEYEALGLPPRTLAGATQLRLLAVSSLGVAAALVGGILALRLIGALVAVTGMSSQPLLEIEVAVAWKSGVAVLAGVSLAAVTIVALLVGRALREPAARRLGA